ncbi:hypothetical protein Trydic_g12806 [Trypoxylus dichotomus]
METARSCVAGSVEYSRCEGYAVYLVGAIYYKLLNCIDFQLMRLSRELPEKRSQYEQRHEKVILQHDNARSYVAKPVKTYLETLTWKVLPHLPYPPDIAPSDCHLFRSMAHGLADQ